MTAAIRLIEMGAEFGAVCWSLQEHVFAACIEVSERALAHTGKTELLLGGGVACNSRINEMAQLMCEERGAKSFTPKNQYCVDNGTMIAVLGKLSIESGHTTALSDSAVNQNLRTDDTIVTWS
jgi:tRNA A37 threonylcarbamoyltransferase TsaD